MKKNLFLFVIMAFLFTQLFAQKIYWDNREELIFSRFEKLLNEGSVSERKVIQTLEDLGCHFSMTEITELIDLMGEGLSKEQLKEVLFRFEVRVGRQSRKADLSWMDSVPISKDNDLHLIAEEQATIVQVLEDFQVNENVGDCNQSEPAIGVDKNGNFAIIWRDERNGVQHDIYCQRYSSDGNKLGPNFKVNDTTIFSANWYIPAISMNSSGNFVIVWIDSRERRADIYGQRYDKNGSKLGNNFKINDYADGCSQRFPDVCIDDSSYFIVVWKDKRNGDYDIYCQRFNNNGVKLGVNFRVNDDIGNTKQYQPAIEADSLGNFVVVWMDERYGNYDIYCQQFAKSGTKLGINFRVNDDSGENHWSWPAISVSDNGNFAVVWTNKHNGKKNLYCQRYNNSGIKQGYNFQVNDIEGSCDDFTDICMDRNGNFVIVWEDIRNNNDDIYFQRYNYLGIPQGGNFMVNDVTGNNTSLPAIGTDDVGNFVVAWEDWRNTSRDIYCQRYKNDGNKESVNFMVNDDVGSGWEVDPAIGVDSNDNFVIVWKDYRNGAGNIYCQRYNSNGSQLGSNFKVNEDYGYWHDEPAIAVDNAGNFVVVWCNYFGIYCQIYNSNGNPLGSNIKVDNAQSGYQDHPAVVIDSNGNFIIVWRDERNGWDKPDIYCQIFDRNGNKLGGNFVVNDVNGTVWGRRPPAIGVDGNGNFIIAWSDNRNGYSDIYCQRYNSIGTALGANFKVNDDAGINYQYDPVISVDYIGNFVVAWFNMNTGYVYCQRFNSDGTRLGSNFNVNDDIEGKNQSYTPPAISMDAIGNFVIVWTDMRNDYHFPDIYCQRFDKNGNTIGSNYRVNNDTALNIQENPDVKLVNELIFYTWEDTRIQGQGYDIFARVDRFNTPPESPILISPPIDSIINDNTPILTWNVPSDVNGDSLNFKVEIATDVNFINHISGSPFESQISTIGFNPTPPLAADSGNCSYTLQSIINDGAYYWRVSATDEYAYGATSTTFVLKIDTASPFTSDHNPTKYAQNVTLNTNIIVHIRDVSSGVNQSSIMMKVNDSTVTPSITGTSSNYKLTYDPPTDFSYNQTVKVSIDADDNTGNKMNTDTYSFSTVTDLAPPFTSDHYPPKYAQNVPINTNIIVHVKDNISGVNQQSIMMKVNGTQVSPIITGTSADYTVTYDPPSDFSPDETVTVSIDADDNAGNNMNTDSYTFKTVHINTAPSAPILISPVNNSYINDATPQLAWSVPIDADGDSLHFKVEIAIDSSFNNHISGSPFASHVSTAGFKPTPPLSQGSDTCIFSVPDTLSESDYWWRVTAFDGYNDSNPSEMWKFTVIESLHVTIDQIETEGFPVINCHASVYEQNGVPLTGLTINNFIVTEDGFIESPIDVTPSEEYSNKYFVTYTTHNNQADSTWRIVAVGVTYQNRKGSDSSGYFAYARSPSDSLIIENATGSTNNKVTIRLTNEVLIRGVQFDLQQQPNLLFLSNGQVVARATGFTLSATDHDSLVTCILYHAGGNAINNGNGAIIELFFNVDNQAQIGDQISLTLKNVIIADNNANELPVTTVNGTFTITDATDVSEENEDTEDAELLPEHFLLLPNYPNPFNSQTRVAYKLPKTSHVMLRICNVLGQQIRLLVDEVKQPGNYSVVWDGRDSSGNDLVSGIYFVQICANEFMQIDKILLLR